MRLQNPKFCIPAIRGFAVEYYLDYRLRHESCPCSHAKLVYEYKNSKWRVWSIPRALLVVSENPYEDGIACMDCVDECIKNSTAPTLIYET